MIPLINVVKEKAADAAVTTGFGVWTVSLIANLNEILQMILFIVSIIAALVAIRYHWKKTPKS